MKKAQILFEQDDHRWFAISRDPERPSYLIDTNEYVINNGDEALITDPGGLEVFPSVFSAVSTVIDPRLIHSIFSSHQDPDVISSLALWLEFNPEMKCYISGLWATFVPHFGGSADTMISIPDLGSEIVVGGAHLSTIPAHYLHSSGNFHLYDPKAQILFSGDVGAALLPESNSDLFVSDFDRHIRFAEGFHKRWMGSNSAKRVWCEKAASLKIDMICPQHGSVYAGEDVERFINWFDELHVGLF
ncbi:MBL fold metallo-hydrolase [Iodobacter sp. LRB]|uniref:MBL fold metallo-hydrolase n=1 Tax=Iodobacter violaceini TaxID=3044271 RepID=A0ABX0KS74_9NEIS|nr:MULTISPECIES: MBL fold metallo-hydrolase [Iodobacter]NHQ87476.1 MBL fold metallo-hydrolase [Iodobacter violacea]PHV02730.1 flavoprotein [Iodobacter sp. BJB302]